MFLDVVLRGLQLGTCPNESDNGNWTTSTPRQWRKWGPFGGDVSRSGRRKRKASYDASEKSRKIIKTFDSNRCSDYLDPSLSHFVATSTSTSDAVLALDQLPFIHSIISCQMVLQVPLLWPAHMRTTSGWIKQHHKKIGTVFMRVSLRRKHISRSIWIIGKILKIHSPPHVFPTW